MNALEVGSASAPPDRRAAVLESALITFARFGYRKTSMEEVAQVARISRPGLYFLFTSKEVLFRAAVTQALERDIAGVEQVLTDPEQPLRERLLQAFDHWAGRYIGPLTTDIAAVINDNPNLLGAITQTMPRQFEQLVTDALTAEYGQELATRMTQTITSTSIGIKQHVPTRQAYLERLEVAIDLLIR